MHEQPTTARFFPSKWWGRPLRIILRVAAGAVLLIALAVFNYKLVTRVLRLDYSGRIEAQLHARLVPVKEPVALDYDGSRPRAYIMEFLHEESLIPEGVVDVPDSHPALITFAVISKLNPYPPVLFEISDNYARQRYHTSFLYLGVDDRYHQITWYGGETFTTPSVFVPKVPGSIYGGDHWVFYRILLSHGQKAAASGDFTEPNLDWIGWLNMAVWALPVTF